VNRDDDVYGAILTDVLAGRPATEIVERDDGVVMTFDARYLVAPLTSWDDPIERRAMRFVRGRVLDVGCGGGRVCLHLQARGLDVVGIDSSRGAIDCCRKRGVRDARLLALEGVDLRLGSFDTIVMLGQNFGLLGSRSRARRLLRRIGKIATARGRIVAETFDPHASTELGERSYRDRNVRRGRMPGQLRVRVRYGDRLTRWVDWLQVSPEELAEDLLVNTGWRLSRTLGDGPSYVAIIDRA
jgi:SAM-dependent methyltransferase